MQIEHVFQDCHDKLPVFEQLLERIGLPPEKAAYIGDDLTDLPVIRYAGFGIAVANAVAEVKRYADYVTVRPGGRGAVREAAELILHAQGRWEQAVAGFVANLEADGQ